MEPKKREVTGKLKECIENITPESIAKTKANMELEMRQRICSVGNLTDEKEAEK